MREGVPPLTSAEPVAVAEWRPAVESETVGPRFTCAACGKQARGKLVVASQRKDPDSVNLATGWRRVGDNGAAKCGACPRPKKPPKNTVHGSAWRGDPARR